MDADQPATITVSDVLNTASELERLFAGSNPSDGAELTQQACSILAKATGAMAVALRSVGADGFAHYEAGWAATSLLDGEQRPVQIRDLSMFERPIRTNILDEMPIVPANERELDDWRANSPADPQVLFCPIRAGGDCCGYMTLVGTSDLASSEDLVNAINLAASVIGQYQVRVWSHVEHRRQLALTEFHRDSAAALLQTSSTGLESAIEEMLVTLADLLLAETLAVWHVQEDPPLTVRTFYWQSDSLVGYTPSEPTRPMGSTPFAPEAPLRPVVIDGREYSEDLDDQRSFVVAPGAIDGQAEIYMGLSRPTRRPWQDWEVAGIGAFADLLPLARKTCLTNERLVATFNDAPLGITIRSAQGELLDCNQAYLDFLGADTIADLGARPEKVIATHLLRPHEADVIKGLDIGSLRGIEMPYTHRSGGIVWGRLSVVEAGQPGNDFFLTHVEDVTEHREALETIRRRASTDPLTGLANRHQTITALELLLSRQPSLTSDTDVTAACAVVLVDLDGFKAVNDTHGHHAGDEVLVEVGRRLSTLGRSTDLIGRYGGDEFVVVFGGPITLDDARRQVERLESKFDVPFSIAERTSVRIGASIGVAVANLVDTPNDLLARADAEMYRDKFRSREIRSTQGADNPNRTEIDLRMITRERPSRDEVEAALDADDLVFWAQPIIAAKSGIPLGVELLARWPQPDGSMIGPSTFVPVVERNGLFVDLDRKALHQASVLLNRWAGDPFLSTIGVNVNISPSHLTYGLIEDVEAVIPVLPPNAQLGLEFIETQLADSDHEHLVALQSVADSGIRVIIDDFGVGHSSLGRLRQFPATNLKLDKSFLDGITDDPAQLEFFRSVVRLLRSLGYPVTVEGVETTEVLDLVMASDTAAVQGFLIAKPVPIEQIDDVLLRLRQAPAEAEQESAELLIRSDATRT